MIISDWLIWRLRLRAARALPSGPRTGTNTTYRGHCHRYDVLDAAPKRVR